MWIKIFVWAFELFWAFDDLCNDFILLLGDDFT